MIISRKAIRVRLVCVRYFADVSKAAADKPPKGIPWSKLTVGTVRETYQGSTFMSVTRSSIVFVRRKTSGLESDGHGYIGKEGFFG